MRSVSSLFVLSVLIRLNDADTHKTLIYEDMACKKVQTSSEEAYNCDHVFEGGCSYKDQKYRIRQNVPQSISLLSCSSSCRCKENGFVCSVLRCPEVGQVTLQNENCHHIYTLEECCNRGQNCPPFDRLPVCEVDGKKYFEGQIFYPNNTNMHCVCKRNFKGEFVMPFCRKVECGIQLKYVKQLQNRCAPMYKNEEPRNCPSSWICPNDDDKDNNDVIVENEKQNKNNPLKCFYGDVHLSLGAYFERKQLDYFARGDNIVRCECIVPPLLTCAVSRTIPW